MNTIVKAVKLLSTLTPDQYKLVTSLSRPARKVTPGRKVGRPRKTGEAKAKRTRRIEPAATE